jgi:hypothetical protein
MRAFFEAAADSDVLHFNFGNSLALHNLDLPIWKAIGKRIVMQFWGSDCRVERPKEEHLRRRKLARVARHVRIAIIGPAMRGFIDPYFSRIEEVFPAVNVEAIQPVYPDPMSTPVLVHIPSARSYKGTDRILRVIGELKRECSFEFRMFENLSQAQVLLECSKCDLVIDQILLESQGVFALEAMALGKPVIARNPTVNETFPGMPLVHADGNSLADVLRRLISDGELRRSIGIAGRQYVEKHHSRQIVAKRLLEIYSRV